MLFSFFTKTLRERGGWSEVRIWIKPWWVPHAKLFLTVPSCSRGTRAIWESTLGGTNTFPTLYLFAISNIPLKSNCHWYFPPPTHTPSGWCYFCYIVFLWFRIKGISSNSQQFVHILQVGKICHGDIKPLTQTDLLPFLSCSARQLPSRYSPLSLPDKSLMYRKPDYPNIAGVEDAIQLQKNMEEQHPWGLQWKIFDILK